MKIGRLIYIIVTMILNALFGALIISGFYGAIITYSSERRRTHISGALFLLMLIVIYDAIFYIKQRLRKKKELTKPSQ